MIRPCTVTANYLLSSVYSTDDAVMMVLYNPPGKATGNETPQTINDAVPGMMIVKSMKGNVQSLNELWWYSTVTERSGSG